MALNAFDLSAFLPYRLAVLSERISRRLSVDYGRSHGLSMAEWRVLVHLERGNQVSIREINRCVNLEKSRVSRAVARLAEAGLVEKLASEQDSRLVAISLTNKGRAVLREIIPSALEFEARLLNALSSDERALWSRITETLHGVLDQDPMAPPR